MAFNETGPLRAFRHIFPLKARWFDRWAYTFSPKEKLFRIEIWDYYKREYLERMIVIRTEIIVIGTEPPCPRCALIFKTICEIVRNKTDISLKHIAFDSQEAIEFGQKVGYKIGTAKDVAKASGININWDLVHKTIEDKTGEPACISMCNIEDLWSPELDALLKPCQDIAGEYGYYMTPIIVIDGNVKHHGSVPRYDEIEKIIKHNK